MINIFIALDIVNQNQNQMLIFFDHKFGIIAFAVSKSNKIDRNENEDENGNRSNVNEKSNGMNIINMKVIIKKYKGEMLRTWNKKMNLKYKLKEVKSMKHQWSLMKQYITCYFVFLLCFVALVCGNILAQIT